MREFFRGWRWKVECVTLVLVLALLLAVANSRGRSGSLALPLVMTGRGLWSLMDRAWQIVFRVNDHPGASIRPRPNSFGDDPDHPADATHPENT